MSESPTDSKPRQPPLISAILLLAFGSMAVMAIAAIVDGAKTTTYTSNGTLVLRTDLGTPDLHPARQLPIHKDRPDIKQSIGSIRFPDGDYDINTIYEGVDEHGKPGVRHFEETALPGSAGNVALYENPDTTGGSFANLESVQLGDPIHLLHDGGLRAAYEVFDISIADSTAVDLLGPTPEPQLTLIGYSSGTDSDTRLVVLARLMSTPSVVDDGRAPVIERTTLGPG